MSRRARAWALAGALCGAVVAADQATKAVAEAQLVPGERFELFAGIELTNVHNRGIAFGLADGGQSAVIAFTVVALALLGVLFHQRAADRGMWLAVGLLAGGALGNLADRVRADAVTDFVDLPAWPAFNLADVAITAGVAAVALIYLREERSRAS